MGDDSKRDQEFGQIKQICLTDIPRMEITINKIFDRLEGNDGLVARIIRVEEATKRVPSQRMAMIWGALWGGISGAATIAAFFGIRHIMGN